MMQVCMISALGAKLTDKRDVHCLDMHILFYIDDYCGEVVLYVS